ncbi:MAG TPA: aspartate/glutamate racemase family protein [Pedococcus sp.]|jgi:Asp/Glu/hydantoin racemase|nr:aspartate/glutamate racemase family protein [Pedococcus sp.]
MRLLAITPIHVSDDELRRRQGRYDRLAPQGVSVRLEDVGSGSHVPRSLETAEDIVASEEALLARFGQADLTDVDGLLPDCVLDPVVEHEQSIPLPVFGICRLSAHFLAGFGGRLGAVARNQAIASELDRKLKSYGMTPERSTVVLDLSVEDIADDALWAAAVDRTVASLPCDYVINACSAVDIARSVAGPTLVDPTWTALRLVAMAGTVGGPA